MKLIILLSVLLISCTTNNSDTIILPDKIPVHVPNVIDVPDPDRRCCINIDFW